MKLANLALNQSVGSILVHNIVGPDGRKVLSKGHVVQPADLETLRALGNESVYVAVLNSGDVREDDAAAELGRAVAGQGIQQSKPSGGRVNFYAAQPGFLRTNRTALLDLNAIEGVTLATIRNHTRVNQKKMVATLKTIGLALPRTVLDRVRQIKDAQGPVFAVVPVTRARVAILLTGSENGRQRVPEVFAPPIRDRITKAGARVISEDYVLEQPAAIAQAIGRAMQAGADLVILAGETSIMDRDDVTPRGIEQAGGAIELYGAPVEPGNLLLLAYCGQVPIIGAPGCIKSRETNVVDLILPPLLTGEHVTRGDIVELAEGGLLLD